MCAFSSRGSVQITEAVKIFDAKNGQLVSAWERQFNCSSAQLRIELSPAGKFLVSRGYQREAEKSKNFLEIRALDSEKLLDTAQALPDDFDNIYFSNQDGYILVTSQNKTLRNNLLIKLPEFKVVVSIPTENSGTLVVTNDERWLVQCNKGRMRFFSTNSGSLDHEWLAPEGEFLPLAAVSPTGNQVALIVDGRIVLCDGLNGRVLAKSDGTNFQSVFFSACGTYLIARAGDGTSIFFLESSTSSMLKINTKVNPSEPLWIENKQARYYAIDNSRGHYAGSSRLDPVAIDLTTGKTVLQLKGDIKMNRNPLFAWEVASHSMEIYDLTSGEKVFSCHPQNPVSVWARFCFSKQSSDFISYWESARDNDNSHTLTSHIVGWKLRRPLAWYGVAWLPEFWLTFILGVGFLWSVWRDRRTA